MKVNMREIADFISDAFESSGVSFILSQFKDIAGGYSLSEFVSVYNDTAQRCAGTLKVGPATESSVKPFLDKMVNLNLLRYENDRYFYPTNQNFTLCE